MARRAERAVGDGHSMTAFIARTVQADEYVVLIDNKVAAGPFATAAEAVKAREELLKAGTASGCN